MPNAKTSVSLADVARLSDTASQYLRTGALPDPNWFKRAVTQIRRLHQPAFYRGPKEQAKVLQAIRRFTALADLVGDYPLSRLLIEPHVEWTKGCLYEANRNDDPNRIAQAVWYVVVYSFVEHRAGHYEIARDTVKLTIPALELIPANHFPEMRHRTYYALGRHCQNLRTLKDWKEAEHCYTNAIEYCVSIALDSNSDKSYALYRVGLTMVGLGRIFRDRGELNRAYRQMSVARLLLTFMPQDENNNAYAGYLLGSILRQQDRLQEAISLLSRSLDSFDRIHHHRYYLRCRHELAKAHFNSGAYDVAEATLRNEGPTDELFGASADSKIESSANDSILKARLLCERARISLAGKAQRHLDGRRYDYGKRVTGTTASCGRGAPFPAAYSRTGSQSTRIDRSK